MRNQADRDDVTLEIAVFVGLCALALAAVFLAPALLRGLSGLLR